MNWELGITLYNKVPERASSACYDYGVNDGHTNTVITFGPVLDIRAALHVVPLYTNAECTPELRKDKRSPSGSSRFMLPLTKARITVVFSSKVKKVFL